MRLIRVARYPAAQAAALAGALAWVLSASGVAQQTRPVTAGVYNAAQAARGQTLYKEQCASCHGGAMEGTIGPAIAGALFLEAWSARPLAEFVDTIHKTMPFSVPGSLSRQQSIDLTAYVLQVGQFPAGAAELSEAQLASTVFPTIARSVRLQPDSGPDNGQPGAALIPPVGNLAELMRAIAFPNANIIFNLQIRDPAAEKPASAPVPFDYAKWGATVYPGWLAVDQAALALAEAAPLLLTPGRRCQNGRAAPVDRADYRQYVADLVKVGQEAYAASRARRLEAFVDISDKLNAACANCHMVYRDKGGPEGSGAARCQ